MSEPTGPDVDPLTAEERRLVRLFRLSDPSARGEAIRALAMPLLARYSISELWRVKDPQQLAAELAEERSMDVEERLLGAHPWGVPGALFNLDDLGDPGDSLESSFPEPSWDLFRARGDDKQFIDAFEEMYQSDARCQTGSMYDYIQTEWVDGAEPADEEEEAKAENEFRVEFRKGIAAFLEAWRENVVARLERRIELPESGAEGE